MLYTGIYELARSDRDVPAYVTGSKLLVVTYFLLLFFVIFSFLDPQLVSLLLLSLLTDLLS